MCYFVACIGLNKRVQLNRNGAGRRVVALPRFGQEVPHEVAVEAVEILRTDPRLGQHAVTLFLKRLFTNKNQLFFICLPSISLFFLWTSKYVN